jgi:putative ABC transport system substrate-binding protein
MPERPSNQCRPKFVERAPDRGDELPVEQATRYELVINLRTAIAIGVTVRLLPYWRADEVIE